VDFIASLDACAWCRFTERLKPWFSVLMEWVDSSSSSWQRSEPGS